MILGFFLQVGKLMRESKILVQIYPLKFISGLKIFKNDLFGDVSALRQGGIKRKGLRKLLTFLGMYGIIYIENKERRKNKWKIDIGQFAPTAEQTLIIVLLLMMAMMGMRFTLRARASVMACGKKWEWEEKFILDDIRFFKEVGENED